MADPTLINRKVSDWLLTGETGSSSKAMAAHLSGRKAERFCYPSDNSDLGRCIKLLTAIPELRPLLPNMVTLDQYWAALIPRWAELEESWRHMEMDAYELLRSILDPIEATDPNVIVLGKGATMRVGR
ncbi:MAG: ftsK [Rhodospirillales bacterium]|nr:ftsK [Rhodospirillales bacterium]